MCVRYNIGLNDKLKMVSGVRGEKGLFWVVCVSWTWSVEELIVNANGEFWNCGGIKLGTW